MRPLELIKWRREHGYTQKELADILGVAGNAIYRWEKAMRDIPSFLHLTLECIEKKGDELKSKGTKKERR